MEPNETLRLTPRELAEIAARDQQAGEAAWRGWATSAVLDRRKLLAHIRALESDLAHYRRERASKRRAAC